jgi:N6-adenosine-specific RNA methylase IME4
VTYATILADPPWTWSARSPKGEGRSARKHYGLLTLDEIKGMRGKIEAEAASDSALLLWATSPMMPQALEVMQAWGYIFKSVAFVWVKVNKGMCKPFMGLGYWTRQNAEFVLLGTRGQPHRISKAVSQIIIAERREHSRKPDEIYTRIEALLPGPYLEMFARQRWPGWYSWGDEVDRFPHAPTK